jgi:vacuolar-type H+-ATPase subunit I/STV1
MSKINTINGGYVGGSPKVQSTNHKKQFIDTKVKSIDAQDLADNITQWFNSDRITIEGIQIIANQLQQLCGNKVTEYDKSLTSLESQVDILDSEIQIRKSELSNLAKQEDLADMVETIETFFGKDKIESIRNLLKNQ